MHTFIQQLALHINKIMSSLCQYVKFISVLTTAWYFIIWLCHNLNTSCWLTFKCVSPTWCCDKQCRSENICTYILMHVYGEFCEINAGTRGWDFSFLLERQMAGAKRPPLGSPAPSEIISLCSKVLRSIWPGGLVPCARLAVLFPVSYSG